MKTADIYDTDYRRRLVSLWLDTGTTIEEERMLADYYRNNRPDEDEKDVAALIIAMQSMQAEPSAADEDAAEEYDRILESRQAGNSRRRIAIVTVAAAAAIAVLLTLVYIIPDDRYGGAGKETAAVPKSEIIKPEQKEAEKNITENNSLAVVASQKTVSNDRRPITRRPPVGDNRGALRADRKASSSSDGSASTVTMEDIMECVNAVETLGLGQEGSYEIVPAGNVALIRLDGGSDKQTAFMAVNSEEDGSVKLVSMGNINF